LEGAPEYTRTVLLSKKKEVQHIYSLEFDPYCIDDLQPQAFRVLEADESKITRVLGSFNRILLEDELDYVVSIGALHHSANLQQTFEQCYKALKPGGWLIATEPVEFNTTTSRQVKKKAQRVDPNAEKKYGKKTVRHGENGDHYYRLFEYECLADHAGFDVWAFTFDEDGTEEDGCSIKGLRPYRGFKKTVITPFFSVKKGQFDRLLLLCQRPVE